MCKKNKKKNYTFLLHLEEYNQGHKVIDWLLHDYYTKCDASEETIVAHAIKRQEDILEKFVEEQLIDEYKVTLISIKEDK